MNFRMTKIKPQTKVKWIDRKIYTSNRMLAMKNKNTKQMNMWNNNSTISAIYSLCGEHVCVLCVHFACHSHTHWAHWLEGFLFLCYCCSVRLLLWLLLLLLVFFCAIHFFFFCLIRYCTIYLNVYAYLFVVDNSMNFWFMKSYCLLFYC